MSLTYLLQAPQGGGTFQIVFLLGIIGLTYFLVIKPMKKREVANSNVENVENLDQQLALIIAKYRNGFGIIVIASIIQFLNTYYYLIFINKTSNFKFDEKMDNYFNQMKSNTEVLVFFTIVSSVLFFCGFLKLWGASIIKK
jgi:preprotein translocase subunit YajC